MEPKVSFQDFLEKIDPLQAEVVDYLNTLFLEMEGVSRKIRYRVPFYDFKSWICYLNPVGKAQIELCFLDGIKMCESYPLLDMKNRKAIAGYTIEVNQDLEKDLIVDMVKHAIRLKN